jgi:hypothetical protein
MAAEVAMRLREDQIARVAETVLSALDREGLITVKSQRGAVLSAIGKTIAADVAAEATLEREAERILEETLRGMGSGAAAIDRHRMLKMIKDKLAKDRRVIL